MDHLEFMSNRERKAFDKVEKQVCELNQRFNVGEIISLKKDNGSFEVDEISYEFTIMCRQPTAWLKKNGSYMADRVFKLNENPSLHLSAPFSLDALLSKHRYATPTFPGERVFPVTSVISMIQELKEHLQPKWIPVTERLPDPLQACNFIIDKPDSRRHGKVYGGTYTGDPGSEHEDRRNEFSTPGISWNASHWMPSPMPGTNGPVT